MEGAHIGKLKILLFKVLPASRWQPWLEGDARKVHRHQRRQYELRVSPQSKRPVALRSPRRRHDRPHPCPEVLPSRLLQAPSSSHHQRRPGKCLIWHFWRREGDLCITFPCLWAWIFLPPSPQTSRQSPRTVCARMHRGRVKSVNERAEGRLSPPAALAPPFADSARFLNYGSLTFKFLSPCAFPRIINNLHPGPEGRR